MHNTMSLTPVPECIISKIAAMSPIVLEEDGECYIDVCTLANSVKITQLRIRGEKDPSYRFHAGRSTVARKQCV